MATYKINNRGSSHLTFPTKIYNHDVLVFNTTSTGPTGSIIEWTVPITGTYRIAAFGGKGGGTGGGRGARIEGNFHFEKGTILKLLIGQDGSSSQHAAGGGGGTFVTTYDNEPLIVAGGGGGSLQMTQGSHGLAGTSAADGYAYLGSSGEKGINGLGGHGSAGGQGGAGFYGDAVDGGAQSFLNGGSGGGGERNGGFGGGGGATGREWSDVTLNKLIGAGGGGGYSGGGGARLSYQVGFPEIVRGGGGGSFNAGTEQVNSMGGNSGDGRVEITALSIEAVNHHVSFDFLASKGHMFNYRTYPAHIYMKVMFALLNQGILDGHIIKNIIQPFIIGNCKEAHEQIVNIIGAINKGGEAFALPSVSANLLSGQKEPTTTKALDLITKAITTHRKSKKQNLHPLSSLMHEYFNAHHITGANIRLADLYAKSAFDKLEKLIHSKRIDDHDSNLFEDSILIDFNVGGKPTLYVSDAIIEHEVQAKSTTYYEIIHDSLFRNQVYKDFYTGLIEQFLKIGKNTSRLFTNLAYNVLSSDKGDHPAYTAIQHRDFVLSETAPLNSFSPTYHQNFVLSEIILRDSFSPTYHQGFLLGEELAYDTINLFEIYSLTTFLRQPYSTLIMLTDILHRAYKYEHDTKVLWPELKMFDTITENVTILFPEFQLFEPIVDKVEFFFPEFQLFTKVIDHAFVIEQKESLIEAFMDPEPSLIIVPNSRYPLTQNLLIVAEKPGWPTIITEPKIEAAEVLEDLLTNTQMLDSESMCELLEAVRWTDDGIIISDVELATILPQDAKIITASVDMTWNALRDMLVWFNQFRLTNADKLTSELDKDYTIDYIRYEFISHFVLFQTRDPRRRDYIAALELVTALYNKIVEEQYEEITNGDFLMGLIIREVQAYHDKLYKLNKKGKKKLWLKL